jgi:hypothetical protein
MSSLAEQIELNKEKLQKIIDEVDYSGEDCDKCNTGIVRNGVCNNRDCKSNS